MNKNYQSPTQKLKKLVIELQTLYKHSNMSLEDAFKTFETGLESPVMQILGMIYPEF